MVFCVNCGEKNIEGSNFCFECGTKLSDSSETLSEDEYRATFTEYYQQFFVLMEDFGVISKSITGLSLDVVDITLQKIEDIQDEFSNLLSQFKSIGTPEKFQRLHNLWSSVYDYSLEAMGEMRKAVELNDQSHINKATYITGLMGEKIDLAIKELNKFNDN